MKNFNDTIVAISTPPGYGAIGILRITGPSSKSILSKIVNKKVEKINPRKIYFGEFYFNNEKIDQVIFFYFKSPNSYTSEDLCEIHFHGNPVIGELLINSALSYGARVAEPGEFTLRAFINGKIDLTQAEAISQLISARSEEALKVAKRQLNGELGSCLRVIQNDLLFALANLEVDIDYNDEEIEIEKNATLELISNALIKLIKLQDSYKWGKRLAGGINIIIVGRTNTGKSSLLNALLEKDRAIVDSKPGTTRDYLEEEIKLGGKNFYLVDTAGYRKKSGAIESHGIELMYKKSDEADLILLLIDMSRKFNELDKELIDKFSDKNIWIVFNKKDKKRNLSLTDIESLKKKYKTFTMSAKYKDGIDELKNEVIKFNEPIADNDMPLTINRHYEAVVKAIEHLKLAQQKILEGYSSEISAEEIHQSLRYLAEILGDNITDSLLDTIFSKFCVGK